MRGWQPSLKGRPNHSKCMCIDVVEQKQDRNGNNQYLRKVIYRTYFSANCSLFSVEPICPVFLYKLILCYFKNQVPQQLLAPRVIAHIMLNTSTHKHIDMSYIQSLKLEYCFVAMHCQESKSHFKTQMTHRTVFYSLYIVFTF